MQLILSGRENNLPGLDHAPLVPLEVIAGAHQEGEHHHALDRHLLPHIMLRATSPHLSRNTYYLVPVSYQVFQHNYIDNSTN